MHIWWVNVRDFDADVPALRSVLSVSEQARAKRFWFLRDRNNYIIRHGILRMLLSLYAGQSPKNLYFTTREHGKPELRNGPNESRIHFSLSHSGGLALYGITGACPIGVDVESVRPIPECVRIASEFFSQAESESLMAFEGESRIERFFDLWTRHEALLKATGEGLGNGRERRDAPQPKSEGSGFIYVGRAPGISAEWRVRSFSPVPGYIGAVAFPRPDLEPISSGAPVFSLENLSASVRHFLPNPVGI